MVIYLLIVHVVWILIHGNIVYGANILEGIQYIGCYKDGGLYNRAMLAAGNFRTTLTNQLCIETCKAKGFTFAGTQYAYECFCGESYNKYGIGTGCDSECHGNRSQTCGGSFRYSVYAVCPFGKFGVQCDKFCPTNCKKEPNAVCQFFNGKCVYGCNTDHDGPYCDLPCKTLKGDPRTEVGSMNYAGGTFFNLFTTLTFSENTQVKGVQYYSLKSGRIYISFWRKDGTETNKWTMVDKIEIQSSSTFGPQEYLVKNRTIDVQAGDAVAVHYKAGDPGGVIPNEKSTNGQRTENIKDENLHDVINVNIQDVDWNPGYQITHAPESGYKLTAAIKILYNCAQAVNCDPGKFGPNCLYDCPITNCFNNVCHRYIGDECVEGCIAGKTGKYCDKECDGNTYGRNCEKTCAHCKNDEQCDTFNGACVQGCTKGWRDLKCDTECTSNTYGENCAQQCNANCVNGCERKEGHCNDGCKSGWMGLKCEQACPNGKYGIRCSETCSINCRNGEFCNKKTGYCDNGCKPGYDNIIDKKCLTECNNNHYGYGCQTCSIHCHSGCNKKTVFGVCIDGCTIGYAGLNCTKSCAPGKYGINCVNTCSSSCFNDNCHAMSVYGTCTNGCKTGFKGHNCSEECQNGKYGSECSQACGHCAKSFICHHETGKCPSSKCEPGYTTDFCTEPCTDGTYGENCSVICSPHCKYQKVCDQFSGVCLDGCKPGWTGQYCDKKCFELSGDPRTLLGPTNEDSSTSFTIFPDLKFDSPGEIIQLTFYAVRKGIFYLDIWRENVGKINNWMLVNIIKVNASKGLQVYPIPKDMFVTVDKGDCFGIHYSTNDNGVIAFESSIAGQRTPEIQEEYLHQIIYSDLYDQMKKWKPRDNFTHSHVRNDIRKSVALKILLNCETVASKEDQEVSNNNVMIAVASVIGCIVIATTVIVSILIYLRRSKGNERSNTTKETQDDKDKEKSNSDVNYIEVYEEIDVNVLSDIGNEAEESYQAMESYKPETQKTYETLRV